MVRVDVAVPDVTAAVDFYVRALGGIAGVVDPRGECDVDLGGAVLHVCDEGTHAPDGADRRYYHKGRVPRLELQVDDVAACFARSIAAGAIARSPVPADTGESTLSYVQILDPFGHLWSFARAVGA